MRRWGDLGSPGRTGGSAGAKGREEVGTAGATGDLCRTGSTSGMPWPFAPAARQVGSPPESLGCSGLRGAGWIPSVP